MAGVVRSRALVATTVTRLALGTRRRINAPHERLSAILPSWTVKKNAQVIQKMRIQHRGEIRLMRGGRKPHINREAQSSQLAALWRDASGVLRSRFKNMPSPSFPQDARIG